MATQSYSARPWGFKLTDALVIAACLIAMPAIILASQPARPTAPVAAHLTEAEFTAAKCYALRAMIETGTDPVAVAAWAEKEHVDARACRELITRRAVR